MSSNIQEQMNNAQSTVDNAKKLADIAATSSWTPELIMFLTTAVLIFTFSILALASILIWKNGATAHQVLRLFGIISIICAATLLLIVGYSDDQLTPIVGLFGAIAGYLLGKDGQTQAPTNSSNLL